MIAWSVYRSNNIKIHLSTSAYPITAFINDNIINLDSTVAIRGFGLRSKDFAIAAASRHKAVN